VVLLSHGPRTVTRVTSPCTEWDPDLEKLERWGGSVCGVAALEVARARGEWFLVLRAISVIVDGQRVAKFRGWKPASIDVADGMHSVSVQCGSQRSPLCEVWCDCTRKISLEMVGPRVVGALGGESLMLRSRVEQ
jgi:hypothetical protein